MRQPSERVPVRGISLGECPGDVVSRQPADDVGVVVNIFRVIVVHEPVPTALAVSERDDRNKSDTHKDDGATEPKKAFLARPATRCLLLMLNVGAASTLGLRHVDCGLEVISRRTAFPIPTSPEEVSSRALSHRRNAARAHAAQIPCFAACISPVQPCPVRQTHPSRQVSDCLSLAEGKVWRNANTCRRRTTSRFGSDWCNNRRRSLQSGLRDSWE